MTTHLERLLAPRSIAVVGASASPEKAGHQFVRNLATFPGPVYAINRNPGEILGRKTYPSLAAVGAPIDLVALCVPADACVTAMQEAAAIKAGAVLIAGGGFGESGDAGKARQAQVLDIVRTSGMRLLGPNTAGFANMPDRVAASFWPGTSELPAGKISIVAQSSGINITIATELQMLGYGVRLAVGVGNSIDVTAAEVVDFLADDAATGVIALHIEGIPAGRALYDAIARAVPRKPVVAITVGRTDVGTFAKSHTGNLIGSFALKRAAFRQAGAVVVDSTSDLVDAVIALSCGRIPASSQPGVGVLTGQGGPGLFMLDELRAAGVHIPEFAPETIAKIESLLPPMTYMRNPVDTARPGATFSDVVQAVADDPGVDALVMYMLHEAEAVDLVDVMKGAKAGTEKPIVVGSCGLAKHMAQDLGGLIKLEVPAFCGPERAARATRALVEDAKGCSRLERRSGLEIPHRRSWPSSDALDELEAKSLLMDYDIPVPRALRCSSREEAFGAFADLAKPVAVKVLNSAILHKTEVGGVHLNVTTEAQLSDALGCIDCIKTTTRSGYLLEEMAKPGVDLIIGGVNDASFGPTVMVGIGGTAAEALRDNVIRLAPLIHDEALEMLSMLGARALLNGWRGAPPVDKSAVAHAIVKVGEIMCAHPEIKEMDINPFRAFRSGGAALDCVVVLVKSREPESADDRLAVAQP